MERSAAGAAAGACGRSKGGSSSAAGGALAWGFGITFIGYLIGFIPPVRDFVQHNIELILLAAVVVTLIPTIYHVVKNRREAKRAAGEGVSAD